eukprot:maker-scaffold227_size249015-snap-gene-0.14 protein:Tk04435 transcript:maker-scaffold227_size249015-snap-gene-0.14-mRNA-1 annotation:"upf0464 protein c15orf44"
MEEGDRTKALRSGISAVLLEISEMKTALQILSLMAVWAWPLSHGSYTPDVCPCPAVYRPICGNDGNDYGNDCQAECKGIAVSCEGICPCTHGPIPDPLEHVPNVPLPMPRGILDPTRVANFHRNCLTCCYFGRRNLVDPPLDSFRTDYLIACQHKCPCQEMTEPPTTTATTTTGTAAFQIEGDQTIDTNGVEASESVETDLPFFAGLEEAERPSEEPEEQPIDSCQCPDKYDPVCGVNEITYENPCEIKCDNVTQLCLGRCPCDANDDAVLLHACTCPDVFDLVCGKNGETYQSECFAGCKEVSIDCNGKCPCARFKRLDESQGNPALTGAFD